MNLNILYLPMPGHFGNHCLLCWYRYSSTPVALALSKFSSFISSAPPSNIVTLANCEIPQFSFEEESLFYNKCIFRVSCCLLQEHGLCGADEELRVPVERAEHKNQMSSTGRLLPFSAYNGWWSREDWLVQSKAQVFVCFLKFAKSRNRHIFSKELLSRVETVCVVQVL